MPGIDESRPFVPLKIAVLTVSDTREESDDKSGATLMERIRAAGHVVAESAEGEIQGKPSDQDIAEHCQGQACSLNPRENGRAGAHRQGHGPVARVP